MIDPTKLKTAEFDNFLWSTCEVLREDSEKFGRAMQKHHDGEASPQSLSPEQAMLLWRKKLLETVEAVDKYLEG